MRIVCVALVCICLPAAAQAFSKCTTTAIAGPNAAVAEEGMNPVTWNDRVYTGYTKDGEVGIVTSSDSGKTFAPAKKIFSSARPAGGLRLGTIDRDVYALFIQQIGARAELMFDASHDRGETWDAVTDLGPGHKVLSQISEDGKNVHVAYVTTDNVITVRNSTDAGRTFSAPVRVAPGDTEVVVASQGNNVYLAWNTSKPRIDVFFAYSHDGGATFTTRNLSASRPSAAREPIFALTSTGRLSLIWREDNPMQGTYLQSLDNGVTWSAPVFLDQPTRQYMVVDDGTDIYATYLKKFIIDGTVDWQIYVTRSTDGGHTFAKGKNLSGPTGVSALINDNQRPVPWVSENDKTFRMSALEGDGVHVWSGNHGSILGSVYLGPGEKAAPSHNSVVWQGPDGTIMHAVCN